MAYRNVRALADDRGIVPQQALLDSLSSAVVLLDAGQVVRAANRRAYGLFGLTGVDMPFAAAALPRQNSGLLRRIRSGSDCELQVSGEGGRRLLLRVVTLAAGTVLEAQDVTETSALQQELQSARAAGIELQAVNEELQCANEVIETLNEESSAGAEADASMNAELFQSNCELLEMVQRLRRRVAELEGKGER